MLGYPTAYLNIGFAYDYGEGVKIDKKKAVHYYELAAMGGSVVARHNLALHEQEQGNMSRDLKHLVIAAGGGKSESLKRIKEFYSRGYATKDDYTTALQSYQSYMVYLTVKRGMKLLQLVRVSLL